MKKFLRNSTIAYVLMAVFILFVIGLILFAVVLPIEKTTKIILSVDELNHNKASIDTNTAYLLAGQDKIHIRINHKIYEAFIHRIAFNNETHRFDIFFGGIDGLMLPGTTLEGEIINTKTTLIKAMINGGV